MPVSAAQLVLGIAILVAVLAIPLAGFTLYQFFKTWAANHRDRR